MKQNNLIPPDSTFLFVVDAKSKDIRLDSYIANQFALYSRSYFQHLIEDGQVSLNGKVTFKNSTLTKEGDVVTVHFPPKPTFNSQLQKDIGVKKIYQGDHFLILFKPAGLLVHAPNLYCEELSLVDWLTHHYEEISGVGIADRPGIVHRLDKDTSGLIIIPRTNYAHNEFGQLFRNREIHKTYLAVVEGHPDPRGSIDLAIGRDPVTKTRMATSSNIPHGFRNALTHYRVSEYFDNAALVEVKPITGRTHQIRVHLAAIGHPIIGDKLYGKPSKFIGRQALHAAKLEFEFDDTPYQFEVEPPEDFKKLIATLRHNS